MQVTRSGELPGRGRIRPATRPQTPRARPSPRPAPTGQEKAGNIPGSVLPLFFLQVASLRAPPECGGLLSWLPVFKQRPHLWRLPLQGGPQESGSRHAHLPSPHPPAQGRTGQVGPRGLTASLAVPACGSPGGRSGALQTESARRMFVTIPDQDSGGGKGTGICDRAVLAVLPGPVGPASSCAWTTLDRRPGRGHKDQGSNVGW